MHRQLLTTQGRARGGAAGAPGGLPLQSLREAVTKAVLSCGLSEDDAKRLFERYVVLLDDYRLGLYDKLSVDGGKFVETLVDIVAAIEGVPSSSASKGVRRSIDDIKRTLGKRNALSRDKGVVLEVAYWSLYTLRNRRDAAHANFTPVSSWDVRHIVDTATWVLQEFLRLYGRLSCRVIENLFAFFSSPLELVQVVERIGDKVVFLVDGLSARDRVLAVLTLVSDESSCIEPKKIIDMLQGVKASTVYSALRDLAKDEMVVKNGKCYLITSKGRRRLHSVIRALGVGKAVRR